MQPIYQNDKCVVIFTNGSGYLSLVLTLKVDVSSKAVPRLELANIFFYLKKPKRESLKLTFRSHTTR